MNASMREAAGAHRPQLSCLATRSWLELSEGRTFAMNRWLGVLGSLGSFGV